jgi:hypothetical protein
MTCHLKPNAIYLPIKNVSYKKIIQRENKLNGKNGIWIYFMKQATGLKNCCNNEWVLF